MGIAKDLGKCKGVRKSDNRPCSNFVNRYSITYIVVNVRCIIHVPTKFVSITGMSDEIHAQGMKVWWYNVLAARVPGSTY